jgi:N-acetylneuraminate synthase/N,N'-diacetyllegionaminate synthase
VNGLLFVKKMSKVFIIAEAGVNHNGSLELAYKLCDAAKKAKADAVKFQTWKTEAILTQSVPMADYQSVNTGSKKSQFEMAKELELSYEEFSKIKRYCDKIGIQFLSTPDEIESLEFLLSIGVDIIKIGSGEINNIPYLRQIGAKKKNVILSTGMSFLSDVENSYYTLMDSGAMSVALLHCTSNYPCPMDEVNLTAMLTLREAFKCRVGYSDHTMGIEIPIAAVAMGAEIIEKHFTLDKSMDGPDHKASLNPSELIEMVKTIRNIEKAIGNGIKMPNASEQIIEKVVKKKIVASKHISKGEIFTNENITVKRSENGLSAEHWDLVYGRISASNFDIDQPITI